MADALAEGVGVTLLGDPDEVNVAEEFAAVAVCDAESEVEPAEQPAMVSAAATDNVTVETSAIRLRMAHPLAAGRPSAGEPSPPTILNPG